MTGDCHVPFCGSPGVRSPRATRRVWGCVAGHCCVDGKRAGADTCGARSNGEGEFGEGRREPMPRIGIHAEFVVAAAEVLDERVPCADDPGEAEPFGTAHRPQPGLQPAMIGLDRMIRVLLPTVAGGGQQLIEHPWIRGSPVGAHLGRVWAVCERAGGEPACGR
jgi:hypothetical protein